MKKPKIGLALGGGSAKGFTHIGVLKVLEENNIDIDYIAGTSVGSIMGAHYALYKDAKLLEKIALSQRKRDLFKLLKFNSFKKSLISGKRTKDYINKIIKNKNFSDTIIPFKAIAADINLGDEVVLDKGKLIDAISASISVPGVFSPVKRGRRLLVDGGVLNNIPVDVVKKMGADVIIGVDLSVKGGVDNDFSLFGTLIQTFEIYRMYSTKQVLKKVPEAVIISPKLRKRDVYNFHKVKDLIKEGERAGKKKLPKIKSMIRRNS